MQKFKNRKLQKKEKQASAKKVKVKLKSETRQGGASESKEGNK